MRAPGVIRASFFRILRQISVTEPQLCSLDLARLRKNESPRFTKRIFRGALKDKSYVIRKDAYTLRLRQE
jgi:hypothetical protein